jgi:hypothetical protein
MRTSKSEQRRASAVSRAIDELWADPESAPAPVDPADAELVETARRLSHLPALLGPVDPALERQVLRRVRAHAPLPRASRLRVRWAAAALALLLVGALLLTPLGETAVAQFLAVFRLGRTEVRITPADTTVTPTAAATVAAVERGLSLDEAQAQVAFPIPQPAYVPAGWRLRGVDTYTYPDLPAWVPQPFSLDLVYADAEGNELSLRVYPILLGDGGSISQLNLEAAPIQEVRQVEVNDHVGALMRLGADSGQATWQEVVWEQDDLILALSAARLSEAELLRVASSVR